MILVLLIGMYLIAIVGANLSVTTFGPNAVIINAFVLVSCDLATRDRLHEVWHHRGLVWKMASLIGAGSALSYLLNAGAGQIALASLAAFTLAAIVDTLVYTWLKDVKWLWRSNGSNLASAAVDSLVFPSLAFGVLLPWIILGQFAAKVAGGLMWSLVLETHSQWKGKKVKA